MMRWRPYRGHPEPVVEVEALSTPVTAPVLGPTRAERRAGAVEAAAWLLLHTDVPTAEILDAYLDALDADDRLARRAEALAEVLS